MAKTVNWNLGRKYGLEHSDKWYEHIPEGVVENEGVKILWDINVQCDTSFRQEDLILW